MTQDTAPLYRIQESETGQVFMDMGEDKLGELLLWVVRATYDHPRRFDTTWRMHPVFYDGVLKYWANSGNLGKVGYDGYKDQIYEVPIEQDASVSGIVLEYRIPIAPLHGESSTGVRIRALDPGKPVHCFVIVDPLTKDRWSRA